jgi:hypothetical protein
MSTQKRDCEDCGGVQIMTEDGNWGCTDPDCGREGLA